MIEVYELKIESLRKEMYSLISDYDNLLAPEVINISQRLDDLLNTYDEMRLD